MQNLKKAIAVTVMTGGLALAGAGVSSATDHGGGGAGAQGAAVGSPGVLSGNVVQAPVNVPINVSGNTINVVGLLNPAFGNTAVNH